MATLEQVILVDPKDSVVGVEEKLKAHRLGLLHRAFSVFIYRETENGIEFLLQKRHPAKYHSGGLWANACCGHPRPQEEIAEGATRRLFEELSIKVPLKVLGSFIYRAEFENGLIEHELDYVLIGECEFGSSFSADPEEIAECRWLSVSALEEELNSFPHHFTPWFKPALTVVLEKTCKF